MHSAFLDTISANEWTNVVSTKAMTPVQKKKGHDNADFQKQV